MLKKRLFAILSGLLLIFYVQAQTIAIRVMTMNIHEGGKQAGYSADSFCTCIRTYQPDIVVFQELDRFTTRNGNIDLLTEMGAKLGMYPFYGKAMTYSSGSFGNGILSKYPFFNARTVVSKPSGASEARACSYVDVILPSKGTVRLAVTHLDVSDDQVRITSMAAFNTALLTDNSYPTLLLGDFNASPDSETMLYAKQKWQDIGVGTGNTYSCISPATRIDYVLGYPKSWVKTSYQIVSHPGLSDHCFIVAELEYP
jgi:endonuclease/exonuclease/phosphatase family metal-dependent hydrolase